MKKFLLTALLSFFLPVFSGDISVIIPVGADAETVFAAQELQMHLSAALKKKVVVAAENTGVSGKKIFLGDTLSARKAGISSASLKREESRIRTLKDDIIITGGKPRGVLYGAYEFLERFAGVCWLDPHNTVIPFCKELKVPAGTDLLIKPSFDNRAIFSIQNYGRNKKAFERNITFRTRMRENVFWQEKFTPEERAKWGISRVFGRPSPLNTLYYYIREWPEKGMEEGLSLVKGGKRARPKTIYGPGHVCFTNPKARQMFKKQILNFIRQDRKEFPADYPLLYNLSINDSGQFYCICSGCAAAAEKYKAHSGAMLEFVNDIAEEVEKHYPDITIQTSAYLFVLKAPTGIRPLRNVAVRYSFFGRTMKPLTHKANADRLKHLQDWSRLGKVQIWNYWVNFGKYYPNAGIVNIGTIDSNLKLFSKYNVNYVFSECEFPDTASFHPLRMYAGYQLKKNVDQKLSDILDRFFNGYYRKSAVPMRRLYSYMEQRQQEHPDLLVTAPISLDYLDKAYFIFAEKCLEEAERLSKDDKAVLDNISRERVALDIARLARRDNWKEEKNLPALKKVHARLARNWKANIAYWYDDAYWVKGIYHQKDLFLKTTLPPETGAKYPLPEELKNRLCYDITWQQFTNLREMYKFGLRLVDDPEACGKKAMSLAKFPEKRYGSLALVKDPHTLKFVCGVQSRYLKKQLLGLSPEIPQNEKYDLLRLGRITLTPNCVFFAHRTWAIQLDLDRYFRSGANNTFDIYVSIKFEGPAYVRNSVRENRISIDRVLLVSAENK